MALVRTRLGANRHRTLAVTVIALFGAALLYGDGVIPGWMRPLN